MSDLSDRTRRFLFYWDAGFRETGPHALDLVKEVSPGKPSVELQKLVGVHQGNDSCCCCVVFSQSLQYNIILYNIQNRKTEKV